MHVTKPGATCQDSFSALGTFDLNPCLGGAQQPLSAGTQPRLRSQWLLRSERLTTWLLDSLEVTWLRNTAHSRNPRIPALSDALFVKVESRPVAGNACELSSQRRDTAAQSWASDARPVPPSPGSGIPRGRRVACLLTVFLRLALRENRNFYSSTPSIRRDLSIPINPGILPQLRPEALCQRSTDLVYPALDQRGDSSTRVTPRM
mmetsp:Transcript_88066/g.201259  ORF Transcript_88066/g.201259 Transcript_88066/m.201259 type:complete len:205 (-) Transcript_88066:45-659(-)